MRWTAICLTLALAGCVSGRPQTTPDRALYQDLRKAVEMEESTGGVVDEHGREAVLPVVAESVCAAGPGTRLSVIRWVEGHIEAEGGPAREAWERAGRDDGEIGELLTLERVLGVLREGHERAPDDCPFWLQEDEGFAGVHGDAHRLVIYAESQGGGGLVFQDGAVALGGTGAGRVLFGWGPSTRLTLAIGGELGAVAELPENESGGRTVSARFAGALPVLFRFRESLSVFDFELAPTLRFTDEDLRPPGFRVSIGGGLSTLRVGAFMPHALLWIGYEIQPPHAGGGVEHSLRVGTRVGIDWDP